MADKKLDELYGLIKDIEIAMFTTRLHVYACAM